MESEKFTGIHQGWGSPGNGNLSVCMDDLPLQLLGSCVQDKGGAMVLLILPDDLKIQVLE